MSDNLTLRGAFIRSVHLSNPDTGEKTVSAQCTADFSDTVIKKMKWGQVNEKTGEFKCLMKVSYSKQLMLGETEEPEDDTQSTLNDGEDEPVEVGTGSLASARSMKAAAKG